MVRDWDVWHRTPPLLQRVGRWFGRNEWTSRLLRLKRFNGPSTSRGLVMIQIDGLSQRQFQEALLRGNLPFLSRLCEHEQYVVHPLYSGLPSNTPGVQGELFYGVKGAVPAFSFVDQQSGQLMTMYESASAGEIERRLATQGRPLLEGGSSYSNIFTGGAAEPHFCAATLGWDGIIRAANPLAFPILALLYADVILRVIILIVVETLLALWDCLRGILAGQALFKELEFIFARLGPVILLRELIVRGACINIARGLPVIHLNLIGYDDHAHRRGPQSRFARWPLQGIDAAAARIWRSARGSTRRDYDVWIYSDHGQEATSPYAERTGQTLPEAVREACEGLFAPEQCETLQGGGDHCWRPPMVLDRRAAAVALSQWTHERLDTGTTTGDRDRTGGSRVSSGRAAS